MGDVAVAEQQQKEARIKAVNAEHEVSKMKVLLAQHQADATAADEVVQRAELKKELANRAYIRASQKSQQLATTARSAQTEHSNVVTAITSAENELESLKTATSTTPSNEVVMLD